MGGGEAGRLYLPTKRCLASQEFLFISHFVLNAQEVGRGQNVSDLELMRADSRNGELSSYFDVASSNNTNSLVSGKVCAGCGWMGG